MPIPLLDNDCSRLANTHTEYMSSNVSLYCLLSHVHKLQTRDFEGKQTQRRRARVPIKNTYHIAQPEVHL